MASQSIDGSGAVQRRKYA